MTEKKLRELVETWAGRLGLGHWHIEVNVAAFDEALTVARAVCSDDYDQARIDFQPWMLTGRAPEGRTVRRFNPEHVVVHELLHVCVHGMRRAMALVDDTNSLHRDVQALYEAAYEQREEEVVDRLAWALVSAWP